MSFLLQNLFFFVCLHQSVSACVFCSRTEIVILWWNWVLYYRRLSHTSLSITAVSLSLSGLNKPPPDPSPFVCASKLTVMTGTPTCFYASSNDMNEMKGFSNLSVLAQKKKKSRLSHLIGGKFQKVIYRNHVLVICSQI